MFDKWLKFSAHYYLRITALVILTLGICLHNTLMSIGAIWIVANWLIEADFIRYWRKFKTSPTIWMLLGILCLGLISLSWSEDVTYGTKDLARKMPFFAIPFAIGLAKPIKKKILFFILYIFVGIVLLSSLINYYRYHYVLENPIDVREMSYFISHIRFSILTVLGAFSGGYLILKGKGPKWLWLISIVWLLIYTLIAQVLTGYVLLVALTLYTSIHLIGKLSSNSLKWTISMFFSTMLIIGIWVITEAITSYQSVEKIVVDELEMTSPSGRSYFHDLDSKECENGHYIWIYMQQDEVENEWDKRSEIPYDSLDKNNQPMFGTVLRYLTSKGWRKDSAAVWSLSEAEIEKIEDGCTSVVMNGGFQAKMHEFMYQYEAYQEGRNPNGHSLLQRLEHLSIAWAIISKKGMTGVGIGDVPSAFDHEYAVSNSFLLDENRHRSHNQYLTIWISHGAIGLLMLLGMLIAPLLKRKELDYFHWIVFITLFISLFFQDMLETQAGVTIFGLFYSLVVYREDGGSPLSSDSNPSGGAK